MVLLLLLTSAALFAWLAALDWPGAPNACVLEGDCYCEAARPGWIRQPANTWSCLPGLAVALGIAWHAGRAQSGGRPTRTANRMRTTLFYPALYALVKTYSGLGALFFHASLTDWGGKLDIASMYLFADFWIFYNLTRLLDLSVRRFAVLYGAFTALMLIPRVVFSVWGIELFNLLVAGVIASELWIRFPVKLPGLPLPRRLRVERRWLWVALASYLPALVIWELTGHRGRALCDPHSLLQGHAVWHVLTGIPPLCVYLYFVRGDLGEFTPVACSDRRDRARRRS
jgi:hypothetical protein